MTRNEEIQFEIDKRKYRADCPFDYETGFKRGVEWADKHPKKGLVRIDKVCEYLRNELNEDIDSDNQPMIRRWDISIEEFINNFIKTMERQL